MNLFSLSTEDLEIEINKGRYILLVSLYNNGLISKEVYEDYYRNHAIIIKRPSFFSDFWKKRFNKDERRYILIKQKSLPEPNNNKPDDKKADLKVIDFDKKKEKE